jgi:hypothetical protein
LNLDVFDEDFDCGLSLSGIRQAGARPTICLGARTADSLQALPMDVDQKPPNGSSNQPHSELQRRRRARQINDTNGSLQEVLWAIIFGGGLAVIWVGKGFARLFRAARMLLLKKPSE